MKDIVTTLTEWCTEVTPKEFYRSIFPVGSLENKGEYVDGEYTAIAISVSNNKHIKRYTITDDLDELDTLIESTDFCLMSPISYAGKERKSSNARFLHAMAIDLDGIKLDEYEGVPEGLWVLFWQFDGKGKSNYLPKPTFIVMSGTGLHIYYVFEQPIALYPNAVKELEKLKKRLTWQLWTQGVVNHKENKIQYESLFQGFRIPGTITKIGSKARAFMVDDGEKVTLDYLNRFVPEEYRTSNLSYKSRITLAEAKNKYPEWYDKRVVKGVPKGHWVCKRALYDWWIRQIYAGTEDGHRYWSVMALATYAKKCGISREELEKDALGMVDELNSRGKRPDNPFTVDDVLAALEAYNDSYITYPIHTISDRTGIRIDKNKRNHRKQVIHLKGARAIQQINDEANGTNWREGNGRPKGSGTAANKVYEWRKVHPEGSKSQCKTDTGLTYPTIRKWWEYTPSNSSSFIEYKNDHFVAKVPKLLNMTDEEMTEFVHREFEKELKNE